MKDRLLIKVPRHRIVLGIIVLGIIVAFSFFMIRNNTELTTEKILAGEEFHLSLIDQSISAKLRESVVILNLIAQDGDLRRIIETRSIGTLNSLANELTNLSYDIENYDHIRYIDESGNEILRINYNSGHAVLVEKNKLQNKKHRYYFPETMKLREGDIYISPIDLNIENGVIELPFKPVIRIAAPLFNNAGERRGIVILNYLADQLLSIPSRFAKGFLGDVKIVNSDGYYLHSIDSEDEWGFVIPERADKNFGLRFPDAWKEMESHPFGKFYSGDYRFVYRKFFPASIKSASKVNEPTKANHLILISQVDDELISNATAAFGNQVIHFDFILLFVLLIAAYFYQKRYTEKVRHEEEDKKRQEQIRESEEKFKSLTENSLVGVYLISEDKFQYVNPKFCEIIGYDRAEIVGKMEPKDVVHPDDIETVSKNHKARIEGKIDSINYQFRCIKKNGDIIIVEVYRTSTDYKGVPSVFGTMLDITDRENLIAELRVSEEKYRNVVENSPAMVAVHCKGKLVYFNPAVQKLMGIDDRSKLYGQPVLNFVHPDYRELAIKRIAAVQKTGQPAGIVREKFVKTDGAPFDVEVNAIPFKWKGEPAVQVLIRDITDQLAAEKAMNESLEHFQTLVEKAPVVISIMEAEENYKFLYVNPAWEELFGYSLEEAKELDPFSLLHKETMLDILNNRESIRVEEKESDVNLIHTLTKSGKEVWLKISSHEISYMGQRAIISSGTDITQIRKYEAELENSQQKLEDLVKQRTAELDKTTADLKKAHLELKNRYDELQEMNNSLHTAMKSFSGRERRSKELLEENEKLKKEIDRLLG